MLKVTNIPDGTSKDALLFFFENRRKSGGGSIEDLEYDPDTKSAVITFEDPEGGISLSHMTLIYIVIPIGVLVYLKSKMKHTIESFERFSEERLAVTDIHENHMEFM